MPPLRAALDEAQARLEALFESAPVGLGFWDRELRFVRVNRRLAEVNGLAAEAHLGRTPEELFPDVEGIHEVAARMREVIATGRPWFGAEISGETPAHPGVRRHWREDFFPVLVAGEVAGLGAVVVETTEEKRSDEEAALLARASDELSRAPGLEERLRRAVRLAVPAFADGCCLVVLERGAPVHVGVYAADPADEPAARALFEGHAKELGASHGLGRVLREGVPELVPEVGLPFLAGLASGEEGRRRVGALGLRSFIGVPIRGHGGVLGALAFATSRSARRYDARALVFAEELGRRVGFALDGARLLEEARAEAQLREQVMGIVSHDLRNPLAAVLLAARRLDARAGAGPEGTAVRRAAETIARSARRMERLIGDLQDVTAIQRGALTVSPAPHEPGELVREGVQAYRALAAERGIALHVDHAPDLPRVLADHDRILQVLGNLVSNAIKVTPPGGRIGIRAEVHDGFVRFAVEDTGPGVKPEERHRIFEPYRRGAGAEYRGTGLGLAIARGIVEAHGGRIGVEARPSGGAAFWFTLGAERAGSEVA